MAQFRPIETVEKTIRLESKDIPVQIIYYGEREGERNRGVVGVNIHTNESVSVKAADKIFRERGGTLIRFDASVVDSFDPTKRNLKSSQGPVDPNRIWLVKGQENDAGVQSSMKGLLENAIRNKTLSFKEAAPIIRAGQELREIVLREMALKEGANKSVLLGLHNNLGDGNINIRRYEKQSRTQPKEVAAISLGKQGDNNLLFITDPDTFNRAKEKGLNALLQGADPKPDGSASQWAAHQKVNVNGKLVPVNYVNSEATFGSQAIQEAMIRNTLDIFDAQKAPTPQQVPTPQQAPANVPMAALPARPLQTANYQGLPTNSPKGKPAALPPSATTPPRVPQTAQPAAASQAATPAAPPASPATNTPVADNSWAITKWFKNKVGI